MTSPKDTMIRLPASPSTGGQERIVILFQFTAHLGLPCFDLTGRLAGLGGSFSGAHFRDDVPQQGVHNVLEEEIRMVEDGELGVRRRPFGVGQDAVNSCNRDEEVIDHEASEHPAARRDVEHEGHRGETVPEEIRPSLFNVVYLPGQRHVHAVQPEGVGVESVQPCLHQEGEALRCGVEGVPHHRWEGPGDEQGEVEDYLRKQHEDSLEDDLAGSISQTVDPSAVRNTLPLILVVLGVHLLEHFGQPDAVNGEAQAVQRDLPEDEFDNSKGGGVVGKVEEVEEGADDVVQEHGDTQHDDQIEEKA
eukprot:Sspe_Gene.108396::Locus_87524_Transcript_3_4_Confidence_0.333_Length_1276::g.108396::m.108396